MSSSSAALSANALIYIFNISFQMPCSISSEKSPVCARFIKLLPFPLFSINPLCAKGKGAKLIRSHEF